MNFHLTIALRYLKSRNKFLFSFSNMLSLIGIILGVFSILVVSSVMNGFDKDMMKRVIGSKAEIRITNPDYSPISNYDKIIKDIQNLPSVKGASPVSKIELMTQKKNNISSSIVYGIELDKQVSVTDLLSQIRIGSPDTESLNDDGIIIGFDLALTLSATVGEFINISSPIGTVPGPFGLLPKTKKFKVIGIFRSGMPEYDRIFTYISLKNAQYFTGFNNKIDLIEVTTFDSQNSYKTAKEIKKILNNKYLVENWSEFEANLFNAIKMEKAVMFLVLSLMFIIPSFNMTGNFIKLVVEKKKEIGVLKSLGTTDKDLVKILSFSGMLIGIIGLIIGLLLAFILLITQFHYGFIKIPIAGYPLKTIPIDIRLLDFLIVPISGFYPFRSSIK